jgi:transposase
MADRQKEMSTLQKQTMVSLREDGFSQYKIAEILEVSQSCISRFLRKFNQSGSIENLPRSGRPRKTNEQGDRKILRCVKQTDDKLWLKFLMTQTMFCRLLCSAEL